MAVRERINWDQINKEVRYSLSKGRGGVLVDAEVRSYFEAKKEALISKFIRDRRTRDIFGSSRKTRLWGFLGFQKSESPIDVVWDLLKSIDFNYVQSSGNFVRRYNLTVPTDAIIRVHTILPEIGVSWVDILEHGTQIGVAQYIYKVGKGRSGAGLELSERKSGIGPSVREVYQVPYGDYILTWLDRFVEDFQ